MKTKFLFFVGLTALASCTFESSSSHTETSSTTITTPEDQNTIELFENGLTCAEVFMTKRDGEKFKKNVTFGESIEMNFVDVEGVEVVDEAVRADVMFLFRNLDGDTLVFIDYGDLREQDFEVPNKDKVDFDIYLTIIKPIYHGQTYLLKTGFKDVRSGNGIEGETEIKVNPNYDIEVDAHQLTYKEVYIFDKTEQRYVLNQKVNISSDNSIIISEIDGFNLKGENAAIGVSLEMKNDKGEDILNVADLAADMPEGMPWAEVKELLVVDFTIGADNPTSYVDIAVKIWDKNGEGSMTITSKVNVTQ